MVLNSGETTALIDCYNDFGFFSKTSKNIVLKEINICAKVKNVVSCFTWVSQQTIVFFDWSFAQSEGKRGSLLISFHQFKI